MKPINVGLLGIGTVGGGTFEVLARNQQEIKRRAEAQGFQVVLQTNTVQGATQHRVVIGPKIDRAAAEALKQDVAKKLGVDAYVTRYSP